MKKAFTVILSLLMTLCWTGCWKSHSAGDDTESADSTANGGMETTYKIEQNRDPKNLSIARLHGYRVQIYTGNDRNKANEVKALFMKNFPDVDNYIDYEFPNFKVRAGDFLSKGSANEFKTLVNKVKGLDGSFVVKCMVNAELPPADTTKVDTNIVYYTMVDSAGNEIQIPLQREVAAELDKEIKSAEKDSIVQPDNKPKTQPDNAVKPAPKPMAPANTSKPNEVKK